MKRIALLLLLGCTGPNSASGRRAYFERSNVSDAERSAIQAGRVLVGMGPDGVLAAWGLTQQPKERQTTADGVREVWGWCIRGQATECPKRVVFVDGKVAEVFEPN